MIGTPEKIHAIVSNCEQPLSALQASMTSSVEAVVDLMNAYNGSAMKYNFAYCANEIKQRRDGLFVSGYWETNGKFICRIFTHPTEKDRESVLSIEQSHSKVNPSLLPLLPALLTALHENDEIERAIYGKAFRYAETTELYFKERRVLPTRILYTNTISIFDPRMEDYGSLDLIKINAIISSSLSEPPYYYCSVKGFTDIPLTSPELPPYDIETLAPEVLFQNMYFPSRETIMDLVLKWMVGEK